MNPKLLSAFATVLTLSLTGIARQTEGGKSSQLPKPQPGQNVYIAALTTKGHRVHSTSFGPGVEEPVKWKYMLYHDFDSEARFRKAFKARAAFKVVDTLIDADFVFLVHMGVDQAAGSAITPDEYLALKSWIDDGQHEDNPRPESALLAPSLAINTGRLNFPTAERIANALVKKFHEAVGARKP